MAGLPDFLVIGAQKAGTSWLHHKLRTHPGIFLPEDKDQAYFCWRSGPHARTLEQYRACFESSPAQRVKGESTAAYFWTNSGSRWDVKPEGYCADIPGRVLEVLGPGTKLVLTLRDPVDRAVSAYLHHLALGDLDAAVSLLDAGDFGGLVEMGFYAAHLRNWLRHFDARQFLVLSYEDDITARPAETLRRLFGFLGVDDQWAPPRPDEVVFEGRHRAWLDGEVWVPADAWPMPPGLASQRVDGREYRRCVRRAELDRLREIYAPDAAALKPLLAGVAQAIRN